jgi:DNA-binding response OmpR family regulator
VAAADPALVGVVTQVLREAELRVFQAYDAQAAYELALALRADVVLTNSCVGTVAGDLLVHALRRDLPQLPILHISAGRAQDRKVEARTPDDVPSLEEPFTGQELLRAVAAVLS